MLNKCERASTCLKTCFYILHFFRVIHKNVFFTVGASVLNASDLKFLYESHENFSALPTFFILPGMVMESPVVGKSMPPGKHADFTNVSNNNVGLSALFYFVYK